jgi:hypothetical protein
MQSSRVTVKSKPVKYELATRRVNEVGLLFPILSESDSMLLESLEKKPKSMLGMIPYIPQRTDLCGTTHETLQTGREV